MNTLSEQAENDIKAFFETNPILLTNIVIKDGKMDWAGYNAEDVYQIFKNRIVKDLFENFDKPV